MSTPTIGDLAPDFTSRTTHGETFTLSALRGTPVVLIFFPWAFSGICTGELCTVRDRLADFNDLGAQVVGVSCDAMFTQRAFADAERLGFELVTDHWPHGAIARAYGIFDEKAGCSLRGSFVLDAEGRVTWSIVSGIGEPRDIAAHLAALSPAA